MDRYGLEYSYFCKYDELPEICACPGVNIPSRENSSYCPEYLDVLKRKLGITEQEEKNCSSSGKILSKKKD